MIYALKSLAVTDDERREMAGIIEPKQGEVLRFDLRVVYVCDVRVADYSYFCIYCKAGVHHFHKSGSHSFFHDKEEGCLGTDIGLPGFVNKRGVVAYCS